MQYVQFLFGAARFVAVTFIGCLLFWWFTFAMVSNVRYDAANPLRNNAPFVRPPGTGLTYILVWIGKDAFRNVKLARQDFRYGWAHRKACNTYSSMFGAWAATSWDSNARDISQVK